MATNDLAASASLGWEIALAEARCPLIIVRTKTAASSGIRRWVRTALHFVLVTGIVVGLVTIYYFVKFSAIVDARLGGDFVKQNAAIYAAVPGFEQLPSDPRSKAISTRVSNQTPSTNSEPPLMAYFFDVSRARRRLVKFGDIPKPLIAGVLSGHAQAATLTALGFYVIDRLHLPPSGSEMPIAIVMMAGASATLAAQWGMIPRLALRARTLIISGALIAATGCIALVVAQNLYGLVIGFALSSLGFGFTRPGFTGGASLAVPLAEQGGVAGAITAANGIAYIAAPSLGMALYAVEPGLPFAAAAALLVGLAIWGRSQLDA